MADDGGLRLQLTDGVNVVVRDLLYLLVGKDLRVSVGLRDGLRVVGPARRERGVAVLLEQRSPAVPTTGEEPKPVHEHDGLRRRAIGTVDLLQLMGRESCHMV